MNANYERVAALKAEVASAKESAVRPSQLSAAKIDAVIKAGGVLWVMPAAVSFGVPFMVSAGDWTKYRLTYPGGNSTGFNSVADIRESIALECAVVLERAEKKAAQRERLQALAAKARIVKEQRAQQLPATPSEIVINPAPAVYTQESRPEPKTFKNAPVFELLQALAYSIQFDTMAQAALFLDTLLDNPAFASKAWQRELGKLAAVLADGRPRFDVFKLAGNSKLPFVAFSSLPIVTCFGAGECRQWCYSVKAWRYPAAFARQAQNAYLLRHHAGAIRAAFERVAALPKFAAGFDLRLYIDGDFSSAADVAFWMDLIGSAPQARVYGYSKAFAELLAYHAATGGAWPANYLLNISSGHAHSAATVEKIRALPITRGDFVAVSIGRKVKAEDHGKPETNKALRDAFGARAFPCPGACGSCTKAGHACGSGRFKGLPIIIAVH